MNEIALIVIGLGFLVTLSFLAGVMVGRAINKPPRMQPPRMQPPRIQP